MAEINFGGCLQPFELLSPEWMELSKQLFPKSTARSCLKGLMKEKDELDFELLMQERGEARPEEMALEYADCLLYLLSSAARSGLSFRDVHAAMAYKIEKNKERKWNLQPDNTYQHEEE